MDNPTAHTLDQLTKDFYQQQARSFSNSRRSAWRGWEKCLSYISEVIDRDSIKDNKNQPFFVADFGCGNLRFEEFLVTSLPETSFEFACFDTEPSFPSVAWGDAQLEGLVRFEALDIIALVNGENDVASLSSLLHDASFNATVCFGVLHHIAQPELRRDFLKKLYGFTRAGGICCISFWCFLDNEKMRRKADEWHEEARAKLPEIDFSELDENDRILGWKSFDSWRYAHSFTEDEVYSLLIEAGLQKNVLATFHSDGKDDDQNLYVVLRKDEEKS